MPAFNFLGNRCKLSVLASKNEVVHIAPYHRTVSGYYLNFQFIHAEKFLLACLGGSRHAGKFLIHAEIVLKCYGSKRTAFLLYFNIFFCLYRLMQAFRVAASWHKAAGKFIYYDYLTFTHDVVLVKRKQSVRL